ncbi:MAG: chemotaxis protein CheW [Verrucomicrobia bacterium]|nr:chemotaxis protein CheW [Verrucomicrobiota bacterium]
MLFILFQLGSDRYALPARDVAEVLPLISVKVLPGAPVGVAGLVDYRGTAVPAIDLTALAFGRPAARRVSTRLLMVKYPHPRGGERLLGVIAEHATELMAKEPADFRPMGITTGATRYLGPIVHDARGMIQRVEVAGLLTGELRAALFTDRESAPPPGPAPTRRQGIAAAGSGA